MDEHEIPADRLAEWHEPGVHRVRLQGRTVWVRVDAHGIAAMTSSGLDTLPPAPGAAH